jgi:hypothetical protein
MMSCKVFGREQSWSDQGAILHVPRGTDENHKKLQSGKTSVPAEIRTEHLPDNSPEHYNYHSWIRVCSSQRHKQKMARINSTGGMLKLLPQLIPLSKKLKTYL